MRNLIINSWQLICIYFCKQTYFMSNIVKQYQLTKSFNISYMLKYKSCTKLTTTYIVSNLNLLQTIDTGCPFPSIHNNHPSIYYPYLDASHQQWTYRFCPKFSAIHLQFNSTQKPKTQPSIYAII